MREERDFRVETDGHCFICLNKIQIPVPPSNCQLQRNNMRLQILTELSNPPIYSLEYFSRYVKMDMSKVFCTNEPISPDLLAKVKRAKLKVDLCEKCTTTNERLSKLYRQLEKIEVEMASHIKDIHGKLVAAESEQLSRSIKSDFLTSKLRGKLEIVNALRNEAAKKCSDKLMGIVPRVKVQNHTKHQLIDKRLKIKYRSRTNPVPNTQIPSSTTDPVISTNPGTEVEAKLDPCNSPTNSITMEDCEDNHYNEYISFEDSNVGLDNSTSLSSALLGVDEQPLNVPTTPQSSVNPKTGKHKCNLCSKEFLQSSNFRTHYRSVHLKVRYKCSLCSKEFTYLSNHRNHLKSAHLGIRFKCEVCSKTFTTKAQLQQHLQRNRCGEEPEGTSPMETERIDFPVKLENS